MMRDELTPATLEGLRTARVDPADAAGFYGLAVALKARGQSLVGRGTLTDRHLEILRLRLLEGLFVPRERKAPTHSKSGRARDATEGEARER